MTSASLLSIHDRDELEAFLRRDPLRHVYALGDLDPFFWERTVWYGRRERGELSEVCLIYVGLARPSLLAFTSGSVHGMRELLEALRPALPRALNIHMTEGLDDLLTGGWALTPRGRFLRMGLTSLERLAEKDSGDAEQLTTADLGELRALYDLAYPDNFFDPRMLETGEYFGVRRGGSLIAVAGIHVHSPQTRVAALGNIATHPDHRQQGHARAATGTLCRHLLRTVDHVALNVQADNGAAVALYGSIGFEPALEYLEFVGEPRAPRSLY